jgi:hypothetical protein
LHATVRVTRTLRGPGIDDGNVEALEVSRVARGDRRVTRLRNARNQSIAEVDGTAGGLPIGSETSRCGRSGKVEALCATLSPEFPPK